MLIYGVSFDLVGKQPIVLLKTADGNKFLPIWIGHPEAAAILMKLQSQASPRPMTHDLLSDMLEQLEAQIVRITVTELRENTFYAQITVQQEGREIEVDSRPSDAIALAIRAEAPIFAADRVIEESAIEFEGEDVDQEQLEAEVRSSRASSRTSRPRTSPSRTAKRTSRARSSASAAPLKSACTSIPGIDAVGAVAQVRERDPERDEDEQRLEQPVRDAERDADDEDRRPAAEEAEQRLAEPAEHQLLDDRRDDGEEHDVRGERARIARLPVRRRQPLLVARALRQREHGDDGRDCVDRHDRADARARARASTSAAAAARGGRGGRRRSRARAPSQTA